MDSKKITNPSKKILTALTLVCALTIAGDLTAQAVQLDQFENAIALVTVNATMSKNATALAPAAPIKKDPMTAPKLETLQKSSAPVKMEHKKPKANTLNEVESKLEKAAAAKQLFDTIKVILTNNKETPEKIQAEEKITIMMQ